MRGRPSRFALRAARKVPWLVRPLVYPVVQMYALMRRKPHWFVRTLKDTLRINVTRKFRFIDGLVLKCDPLDGIGQALATEGTLEPETLELCKRLLRRGMCLFDVGASIGHISLVASRQLGEGGVVHAFEPTPATFRCLTWNLRKNHCANVVAHMSALSDRSGSGELYYYPSSSDQNSLRPLSTTMVGSTTVMVTTVDTVVLKEGLRCLDVLKIDVEGNELAVIRGAVATIESFKPLIIFEISRHQDAYGYSSHEIVDLLRPLGYSFYRLTLPPLPPYTPSSSDIGPACSHFNVLALSDQWKETCLGQGLIAASTK